MSVDNILVSCSPLSGEIRVGRLNKASTDYLEHRRAEVEVISAVTDFMMHGHPLGSVRTYSFDGGKTCFEMTVKPVPPKASIIQSTSTPLVQS